MTVTNHHDFITAGIKADIESWNKELKQNDIQKNISILRKPNIASGIFQFLVDWTIIFASFYIFIEVPLILPLCLLIVGSRQRALSNLIHDSSHWNLSRNKILNDILADLLGGLAMISPVKNYRKSHFLHHRHLGHPIFDPDISMHKRYGYCDTNPPYNRWYKNILYLIFNYQSWKDSNIGSFAEMKLSQKVLCLIWWISFFVLLSYFCSLNLSVVFLTFWQLARASTYHIIRTVAEFLDHSGLPVGSVTVSSRMIKAPNFILKKLFHPHNDNFHALHHFDPSIPQYNLAQAHSYIEHTNNFSKVKKNDSYFLGTEAAIKDLVVAP